MQLIQMMSGSSLTPFEQASFNAMCLSDGLSQIANMEKLLDIMQGLDAQIAEARADSDGELADQIDRTFTLLFASYAEGYSSDA
tara:strand:+ start:610 stop:861 length:252 start_codon:yes stop_codon:yes gene_type:complete